MLGRYLPMLLVTFHSTPPRMGGLSGFFFRGTSRNAHLRVGRADRGRGRDHSSMPYKQTDRQTDGQIDTLEEGWAKRKDGQW